MMREQKRYGKVSTRSVTFWTADFALIAEGSREAATDIAMREEVSGPCAELLASETSLTQRVLLAKSFPIYARQCSIRRLASGSCSAYFNLRVETFPHMSASRARGVTVRARPFP